MTVIKTIDRKISICAGFCEGYGNFMKEEVSQYLTKEEIEEKTNELIDSTFVADLILNSGRYEEIKCD